MAYVVTENCIKCKYTDCVDVCPVDCFHEGPNFLVIDPDECIDCSLCVSECPAEAIFAEDDVPHRQHEFITLNAELCKIWPVIAERRLLKPINAAAKAQIDSAFAAMDGGLRSEVQEILLTNQGDRDTFRSLYPFSPALVQALVAQGVQMPPLGPPIDLAHLGGMESLDPRRMKAVLAVLVAVLLLGVGAWQVVGPGELLAAGTWLWPVSLLLGIGLGVGMAWWPARRVKADPQSPGSLAGVLELLLLAALIAVSVWCVQGVWRAAAVVWGTPQVAHYTPMAPQTWDSSASSKRVWTGPAGMPPLVLYQRKRGPQLQPKVVALPVLHTWGGLWQADARVLDALSR